VSLSWREALQRLREASWQRDEVEILFAPYRVAFAQHTKGGAVERFAIDTDPAAGNGWQAALAALAAGLQKLERRDLDARVRLSNHFVRYGLVPTITTLRSGEERMAAARHQLTTIYGERADRWQVALHHGARNDAAVVAGTEQELLQQLVAVIADAGLELQAVEPLLAAVFNGVRGEISKAPTWLGIAEPDRVMLAYLEDQQWRFIQVERLRGELGDELPTLLERLHITHSAQPGILLFVSETQPAFGLPTDAGWSLVWRPLNPDASGEARPQ